MDHEDDGIELENHGPLGVNIINRTDAVQGQPACIIPSLFWHFGWTKTTEPARVALLIENSFIVLILLIPKSPVEYTEANRDCKGEGHADDGA